MLLRTDGAAYHSKAPYDSNISMIGARHTLREEAAFILGHVERNNEFDHDVARRTSNFLLCV
jgi:hypothetical protein